MDRELMRKRPAEIVTAPYPVVSRTHIVQGPTREAVLREVRRLSKRGHVGGASALAYANGGFAVKILLAKPLPPPPPRWVKPVIITGGVLMTLSGLAILALHLLASVPWVVMVGALILGLAVRRPVITVVQKVTVR